MKPITSEQSRSHITDLVNSFAYTTFGTDFRFRKGQLDQCVDVIQHFIQEYDTPTPHKRRYVMEAPTGSGKSIIAMVVAGVLSTEYEMRGYILVSDLGLLDQYIKDVRRYCKDWGYIKGKSNYTCLINGRDYMSGVCKIEDASDGEEECPFKEMCPYHYANNRAFTADVVVCTYHYWLIHKSITAKICGGNGDPDANEFVICDEAHNAMSIVQNMYSLSVGESYMVHGQKINELFPEWKSYNIGNTFVKLVGSLINDATCNNSANVLPDISLLKSFASDLLTKMSQFVKEETQKGSKSRVNSDILRELKWLRSVKEKLTMYHDAINGRVDKIIVTLSENGKNAILNSTDEGYLMDEYMHKNYTFGLYMSATIGDIKTFSEDVHINDRYLATKVIPSTFDFTNCKIFYNPSYSLSRSTYEQNFPMCVKMVNAILGMFHNYRGCIFVSSYDMTKSLVEAIDSDHRSRIIVYKDAREKASALMRMRSIPNAVLIGPSIFEGISLDDDMCRFSIIAKVPYADTRNKLVKYKLDTFGFNRYAMSAIQNIIQAVGRGKRNETDWCTTFIVDGAFASLYKGNKTAFGDDFASRLNVFSIGQLIN